MSKKGGEIKMMHLYDALTKQNYKISLEVYEKVIHNTIKFLIEYDKFKNDIYHKIFYYAYLIQTKYSQENIGKELGMDQSTISRKMNEIQNYILLKIKEVK